MKAWRVFRSVLPERFDSMVPVSREVMSWSTHGERSSQSARRSTGSKLRKRADRAWCLEGELGRDLDPVVRMRVDRDLPAEQHHSLLHAPKSRRAVLGKNRLRIETAALISD